MRWTPSYVGDLARATNFDPTSLEKVLRLRELLTEFHQHPFLRDRLVLKGGTAVNLFFLALPRLSVDIDLNYVGQIGKAEMHDERPQLEQAISQVCKDMGYQIQQGTDTYALYQLHLRYMNHLTRFDGIELDTNLIFRVCALPPTTKASTPLGDEPSCAFPVLAVEELFAGKAKAFIERRHPRDIYDLHRFALTKTSHDADLTRKLAVLFASTLNHDLRDYRIENVESISQEEVERLLYPLLRADDRPTIEDMSPHFLFEPRLGTFGRSSSSIFMRV